MKNQQTKHTHRFTRSKPSATVETCTCGKFQFTENAGPPIVAVESSKAQPDTARHSPLPWHVCTLGENTPNTSNISDSGGSLVARVESYPYRTTGKADALLIVRAVNNADKLTEALRILADQHDYMTETLGCKVESLPIQHARQALADYDRSAQQ